MKWFLIELNEKQQKEEEKKTIRIERVKIVFNKNVNSFFIRYLCRIHKNKRSIS